MFFCSFWYRIIRVQSQIQSNFKFQLSNRVQDSIQDFTVFFRRIQTKVCLIQLLKYTLCLYSSTTLWKRVTVIKALSASWKIICVDLGTTMSVSDSYFACQSLILLNGTTTSKVVKYSESRTKCSFLTKSPKLRVIREPVCFFSIDCRLVLRAL